MTSERDRRVRRAIRWGGVLYVACVVGLATVGRLPLLDLLFLPALLFLLPALSVAQVPLVEGEAVERIPAYLGSAAGILVLGFASLALGLRLVGAGGLGLSVPPWPPLVGWSVGLTLGGMALMELVHRREKGRGGRETRILRELLPRSGGEKVAFTGLSFVAGSGEEMAYRGYALAGLAQVGLGPLAAAVASSVPFGFLHAYQGRVGIARTAILGFAFAAAVLSTGSLWPAMAAHAGIDLVGGLWLGERWAGGDGPGEADVDAGG